MKRFSTLLGLAILAVVFSRLEAGAEGWILLEAPIKLGTKSAQTTYDESLPLKNWNWKATTDSEIACRAKMDEASRADEERRNIGLKAAAKSLGISEEQARARSRFVQPPRICLRDNDQRLH